MARVPNNKTALQFRWIVVCLSVSLGGVALWVAYHGDAYKASLLFVMALFGIERAASKRFGRGTISLPFALWSEKGRNDRA